MITREILDRTLQIHCTKYGTAFIFDGDEFRYLVTAEHIVRDYPDKPIDIRRDREWKPLSHLKLTFIDRSLDIAVFRLLGCTTSTESAPPYGSDGLYLGQDIYLCGYPTVDDIPSPDSELPVPHIRKGIISAVGSRSQGVEPGEVWLVDALIESGYSGGPAAYVNSDNRSKVLGIVRSIKSTSDIYAVEDDDMNEVEGMYYRRQSGIIEVVDLGYVVRSKSLK